MGVVPRFVDFLCSEYNGNAALQFESAWTLTNIASGTSHHVKTIVKSGAITGFKNLLQSDNVELVDQATWGIGNIAGDTTEIRDMALRAGVVPLLLKHLEAQLEPVDPKARPARVSCRSHLRNATWALSNCCRGKPEPKLELIKNAIPALAKVLARVKDDEVLADALWYVCARPRAESAALRRD